MDNEKFGIWGRTNLGEIFRFAWIEDSSGVVYDRKIMLLDNDGNNPEEYCLNYEEHIIKHSKKLIDLIEVGDFVNGYRVLAIKSSIYENSKRILIYKNERENYERWIYVQEYNGRIHTQDDIVEILTKEQYLANCYKVGGKDE